MEHCRFCRAPITWARTEAGNLMPLDAEPVPDGNVILTRSLGGTPLATVLSPGAEPLFMPDGAERRVPHFATCTNYDPTTKGPKR